MKKLSAVCLMLVSMGAIADDCQTESCIVDGTNEVVLPYFNTRSGWSARFSIINPTEKKVTVSVQLRDVDGNVKAFNHYVLDPYDMVSSGLSPSSVPGSSWWFVSPNDKSCKFYPDSNAPVDEGYVTINSEHFTTFGPSGFCGNDYELVNPFLMKYDYSLWTDKNTLVNDYRELFPVNQNIISSWTKNGGRNTDVVVNLKSFEKGSCQESEYLVSDRDGNAFKTFNTTEPGPAGYPNIKFCHKVNVVHFGKSIFDSKVGVQAESVMPFLNDTSYFNDVSNSGWVQFLTEGRSVTVRSEF